MSFGEEVKRLREAKNLSQASLAKLVGVRQTFISLVERGDRPGVGADVLYALCRALEVPCQHFEKFLSPPPADPALPTEKPKRGRPPKAKPDAEPSEPAKVKKTK